MRRHQLPPTEPAPSPGDSDEESLDELSDELSDAEEAGVDSGAGARSGAGSGVESFDVELAGVESVGVESLVSFAPFEEPFDDDLREIARRRRVVRSGFSSAASSDFTSSFSVAFLAVAEEDFEDEVEAEAGLRRRVVVERAGFFSVSPSSDADFVAAVRRPRVQRPVKWLFRRRIALSATRLASGERLLSKATTSVCLPRSFAACMAG